MGNEGIAKKVEIVPIHEPVAIIGPQHPFPHPLITSNV